MKHASQVSEIDIGNHSLSSKPCIPLVNVVYLKSIVYFAYLLIHTYIVHFKIFLLLHDGLNELSNSQIISFKF